MASAKAIKTYVDSQVTAQDLDFQGDSGGALSIDLDSESLTFAGGTGVATVGSGNTITFNSVDSEIVHDNLSGFVANEHIDHSSVTLTAGNGLSGGGDITASRSFAVDLNELTTETSIADADFIAMVDATDNGSGKITFENLEDAIFASVSGDIAIAEDGTATIQANSVALATDTTGDFVNSITAGTGLTSTGATSGENISHSLSVDASQTQITSVGALNAGSITSGFGAIDIGSSNFTTTGTLDISGGTLTLADNQISGDKVEGGTIAAVTISALTTAGISASTDLDIGSHGFRASTLTADSQTSGRVAIYGANGLLTEDSDLSFSGSTLSVTDLTVSGTLTTTGSVQEVSTTNLNVEDPLILLNKYDSQPANNAYDAGFVIKRGSGDSAPANVAFIWDESSNQFALVDTTEDGTTAGNVTITDYEDLRVGALTADDASTFTSTISAATGSTIGNLTLANGSITDSSGAISFGDENLSTTGTLSAGQITGTSFVIGSADISEAELEILDGANITTAELNIIDGDTAATATTVADADRVVMNDGGVMKQVAVTDLAAYFDDEITAMPNLVTTGTLDSGAISSGFGNIDIGSSSFQTTGSSTLATVQLSTLQSNASDAGFTLSMLDNISSAISIKEATNEYLRIDTTDGSEKIVISKELDINSTSDFGSNAMTNVNIDSGTINGTTITSSVDIVIDTAGKGLADEGGNNILERTSGGYITIGDSAWNEVRLNTTGSTDFVLDNSGRIGIGNPSPASGLHLTGGDNTASKITLTNTAPTPDNVWSIHPQYNDQTLRFLGDSTTVLTMKDTGEVGIGETNPDEKLYVGGSVNNDDVAIKIENTFDDNNSTSRPAAALLFGAASNNGYLRVYGAPADTAANHQIDLGSTAGDSFITFSPAGTERMRVESNGNVYLGGTASGGTPALFFYNDASARGFIRAEGTGLKLDSDSGFEFHANNGASRIDIDSSGRLGIGHTSPQYGITIAQATTDAGKIGWEDGANNKRGAIFLNGSNDAMEFMTGTADAVRMTIDDGNGEVSINRSTSNAGAMLNINTDNGRYGMMVDDTFGNNALCLFRDNGSGVGSITIVSGQTAFNATSDYRLKENEVTLANGLTRLNQLKPYNFNFIAHPDIVQDGFFAHEVAEVVPVAVTGEKDAVNDDGDIEPQQLDNSKLVPLLVKTMQELEARITELEG